MTTADRDRREGAADQEFTKANQKVPKHLVRTVHDLYFEPKYEEFWCTMI